MLTQWIRTIYSDNGVLTDYSMEAQDRDSTFTGAMVAAQDNIYVGQYYPFNSLFIQITVANDEESNLSVQTYNGQTWEDVNDLLDGTKTSGKTLAKSGVIQFNPDYNKVWQYANDTSLPTELSTLKIFGLYWIKLSVSNDLTQAIVSPPSAGTTLRRITYKFTTQEIIESMDPDINEYLTAWESGKTDWTEQILTASQLMALDLRGRGIIKSPANIMRFDDVAHLAAFKSLSVIYGGLGGEKIKKKVEVDKEYDKLKNSLIFTTDKYENGVVTKENLPKEKEFRLKRK